MKKGFTLVELLAVLVILAVILLIAIPIVQKTIQDSKVSANKASIDLYGRAADQAIETYQLTSHTDPTTFSDIEGLIEYNGKRVVCSTKRINDDMTVYLADCKVGEDDVEGYTYGIEPPVPPKANGEVVYFNVKDGVKCSESDYHEDNSKTGYNGINPEGNQTSCLKFYAFNDTEESNKVNLLLDHNTTALVAWNSSFSNTSGPNELLTQLTTDTSGWSTNILTPTNYTSPSKGYTVNYTTRARLITAQEIAQITKNNNWYESTRASWYYFDTLNQTTPTERKYGWLYDRTNTSCLEYGCLYNSDQETYGYWTVSAFASDSDGAWLVDCHGTVLDNYVGREDYSGVRPVIEVAKSSLN